MPRLLRPLLVLTLPAFLVGRGPAGEVSPCGGAELNLIFQDAPIDAPGHQVAVPFANAVEQVSAGVAAGEVGRTTVYAAIVSRLSGGGGVQSWALQTRATGGIRVVDATVDGTASAPEPEGLVSSGFVQVRVPSLREESGFYTAVVLSFSAPVSLDPVGTATVIAATVEADRPQGDHAISGRLEWVDGCLSCSTPFVISASVGGRTRHFCSRPALEVQFTPQSARRGRFIRCDTTADGRVTITDPVVVANHLFLGGPGAACLDTEDCNGDRELDISDVVFGLNFLFRTATPPPAPFPTCGEAETISESSCPPFSTVCQF